MEITFGGFSGIDYSSIIEKLVEKQVEYFVNPLREKQDYWEEKYNAWKDLNMRLTNMRSVLTPLKSVTDFLSYTASVSQPEAMDVTVDSSTAQPTTVRVKINQLATSHEIRSDLQSSASDALGLSGTLIINGKEVDIDSEYSLNQIARAINSADAGVRAWTVSVGDGAYLYIESEETGESHTIDVGDTDVARSLGLVDSSGNIKNEVRAPQNAIIEIEGVPDTIESESNTVNAVLGLTFNLKKVTAGTDSEWVEVNVNLNEDLVVSRIQSFVNQYNSIMAYISEQTAKGKPLQAEVLPIQITSKMRSIVTQTFEGPYRTLSDIGIWTYDKSGMLQLDEEKLRNALRENPEAVMKMFANDTDNDDIAEEGIAVEMDEYIEDLVKFGTGKDAGAVRSAMDTADKQIKDLEEQISEAYERISTMEEMWKAEFDRMDRMIAQMQAQLASLQNMAAGFGGGLTDLLMMMGMG